MRTDRPKQSLFSKLLPHLHRILYKAPFYSFFLLLLRIGTVEMIGNSSNSSSSSVGSGCISLIQRPCYRRGSRCQDPVGNRTTRRPPDHGKETQAAVVWSCLPFIRSGQNHLARHSGRGKRTRQTEEELGRQHQGVDRPGVRQVPEGNGKQKRKRKTWRKLVVKSSVVPQRPPQLRAK